jgi:hypothetical protein
MLEHALMHLLEGRHVVEANEEYSNDVNLDIKPKFWTQLQSLLKSMLAASLPSSGTGRPVASAGQANTSSRGDATEQEMYDLALKSTCLDLLKGMLAASPPSSGTGRPAASAGQANTSSRGDATKLKEMYRLSLKSTSLGQLHALHKLWVV